MADVVQYKLERMVAELDDLEKRRLFSKEEIKEIVKKRRDFEYRLMRRCPIKEDYLRYIEYEKQLESLRTLRKNALIRGMKGEKKKNKWKNSLCDTTSVWRITGIYQRLITRHKGDLGLWFHYLEYCRERRNTPMRRVLAQALKLHPNVSELWIYAAAWEFEHNLNVTAARALMLNGLRTCSKSENLWLEYFRMELIFVNKLRARKIALGLDMPTSLSVDDVDQEAWKKENSDLFMSLNEDKHDNGEEIVETENDDLKNRADALALRELGFKMAYIIFNKAIDAIPLSVRFRQRFVQMLQSFEVERSDALEDEIYTSLRRDFPNDESSWDWLARQHLSKCQREKHIKKESVLIALNKAIQVYDDGLTAVPSARMFGLYAKFLQDVTYPDESESPEGLAFIKRFVDNVEEITKNLLKLYERAKYLKCFNEDLAMQYISFLLKFGDVEAARKLAEEFCTSEFSRSARLWASRFSLEVKSVMIKSPTMSKDDLQSLFELFKHISLELPVSEAQSLWHMAMELFTGQRDLFDQILRMLVNALSGGGGGLEGASLACVALDWVIQNRGIQHARQTYNCLLALPGPSLEFYKHCIAFESQLGAVGCEEALQNMRKLYDSALKIYDQNIELWLDYCLEELKVGGSDTCNSVYWRARKTLRDSSAFIEAYGRLKS